MAQHIRRSFSSHAARDQRIAGRRRFYKNVHILETVSPFTDPTNLAEDHPSIAWEVPNPISAGVDGTQSATNVSRALPLNSRAKRHGLMTTLIPRKPGNAMAKDPSSTTSKEPHPNTQTPWYGIALDGRRIQTPLQQPLAVPSPLLASTIANEWNSQARTINPTQMPIMTLACTALDQTFQNMELYRQNSLRYLPTDTVCYYADPMEFRSLYQRQYDAWQHLHRALEEATGHAPATAVGTEGILMGRRGLPHAPAIHQYAREFVESLDAWHLTAFHSICSEGKSFLTAWYAMTQEDVDVASLVDAARIEEEFNIANWGLVEGQHDYDQLNARIQIGAALILKECLQVDCDL